VAKRRTNSVRKRVAAQRHPDGSAPSVLLAEDREEVRRAIAHLLEGEFHVVGTAENGHRALELAPILSPDVIVLDVCMPVLNGLEAAERLRESGSASKVVFLTVHEDADFVDAALSTGALGYVLKCSAGSDLIPAIHQAVEGKRFVSPSILSAVTALRTQLSN
jgi:DNA-binding NarL/FixJ family response regulator